LDIRTLRRLQQYIKDCKLGPKKRKSTASGGAKAPSKKMTPLATSVGPDSNAMPFPAESDSDDDDEEEDEEI
jgi:hypothetical protein